MPDSAEGRAEQWADTQLLAALMAKQGYALLKPKHMQSNGRPSQASVAGLAASLGALQQAGVVDRGQLQNIARDRSQPMSIRVRAQQHAMSAEKPAEVVRQDASSALRAAPTESTMQSLLQAGQVIRPSEWRSLIVSPPTDCSPDHMRYLRHMQSAFRLGATATIRPDWDRALDRLRSNTGRGRQDEDATLQELGIENNNYAAGRSVEVFASSKLAYLDGSDVVTRPDAVTDLYWIDVKSIDPNGADQTYYNTLQLQAQREGAGRQKKKSAVILTSSGGPPKPSRVLADTRSGTDAIFLRQYSQQADGSTATQWARWNRRANNGEGDWHPIDQSTVRQQLGAAR